jgi:hypothetical protein
VKHVSRRTVLRGALAGAAAALTVPPLALAAEDAPAGVRMDDKSLAGRKGYFRVGRDTRGVWWFVDPDGRPFLYRGVTSVSGFDAKTKRDDGTSYMTAIVKKYGDDGPNFRKATIERLKSWGFNALGAWGQDQFWDQGFPYTIILDASKHPDSPKLDNSNLPDVFDPAWAANLDAIAARLCAPHARSRDLVGYFTDNELSWAQVDGNNKPVVFDPSQVVMRPDREPSLLQKCLAMAPDRPAHKAAWEFVMKRHGNDLARLSRDWGLTEPLASRARLAELTQAKQGILSPGYVADDRAFSQDFAERYFRLTADAIRRHDPNHLILGCRFGAEPGAAVLTAMKRGHVDVLSANNYRHTMYDRVDGYHKATGLPVLIGEFAWVTDYFLKIPAEPEPPNGFPTELDRMKAKGEATLRKSFTHPALAGYTWYRWVDKADFKPPISYGLVTVDDEPNPVHIPLLRSLNAQAEALHAGRPGGGGI